LKPCVRGLLSLSASIFIAGQAFGAGSAASTPSAAASAGNPPPSSAAATKAGAPTGDTVKLTDSQLSSIAVAKVEEREFLVEKQAFGNIDFDEDTSVQVFSPYPGRILRAFLDLGDEVRKDQVLFTLESPDFIAAESNLISAAATLDQTASALTRARALYASKGIDQNDYETAVANQQSAEGALRAARNAVAIFGRTPAEIDRIVEKREVDPALIVKSPIAGRITARNAAPGLYVQPGNPPAPYSVADAATMWMLANVPETDSAEIHLGQPVVATVPALPGREFTGKVTAIGAVVDPSSRRITVRAEIKDPKRELKSNMFATFSIRTADPRHSPAMPLNGVVREGDGTMSVWVVGTDPHVFTRRVVKIGLQQQGYDQIVEGLNVGEKVAVSGAIFLSNILYGGAT
jgi:membrane fusion protein, heavy metal efflux system